MDGESAVQWVPVASFLGIYAEVEADLLVAHLRGSGIPVMRLPVNQPISLLFTHGMPGTFPVWVCVPPEHEQEAAEMQAEQEPQSIPQPVRAVGQWYLASMVLMTQGGGALSFRYGASEFAARLTSALVAGCAIGVLWRGVQLALILRKERRCFPDLPVITAAALTWALLSALLYPLVWTSQSKLAHDDWLVAMVLTSCALVAALLMRWLRRRDEAADVEDFYNEEEEQ